MVILKQCSNISKVFRHDSVPLTLNCTVFLNNLFIRRPSMLRSSTSLRLFGVKNCPTLAMSATMTDAEVKEVVAALGLRCPPVLLTASPILSHIKFSIIRRPSNNFGIDGTSTCDGKRQPGLMDILLRVYLKQYVKDLKLGRKPKKCIIFSRGINTLGDIYSRLMELTNYRYSDCNDSPFVLNHSSLLPPTEKVIRERSSEISLYLSSNKMLMGIDLEEIDIVIFLRPFNQLSALIQGAGRGGRRQGNGLRRRVQVYQLYNTQDFNDRHMSLKMKEICLSTDCTRKLLKNHFVGESTQDSVKDGHCCHCCDLSA